MVNNENPYDDFLKNLARLVEDVMKNLPEGDTPRFIGCTIIAGGTEGLPRMPGGHGEKSEINYEMIESEDRIFITAQIPPETKTAAFADINPDSVRICVDDIATTIPLDKRIDIIHSFYMVRHGVLDIILKKVPLQAPV